MLWWTEMMVTICCKLGFSDCHGLERVCEMNWRMKMNPSTNQFGNRVRVVRVETVVKLGKTLVNGTEISRSHQKLVSCLPKYWTLPMMLLVLLNGTIFVVSFPGSQSPGQWFVPESGAGLVRRDQAALGGERSESLQSAGDRLWTSLRWLQLGVEIVMQWFMQWFWGFEKNGLGSKIFRILLLIKGNHGNWGYPNFRKHPRHWEMDENGQS